MVDVADLGRRIDQDSHQASQTAVQAWTNLSSRFVHAVLAAQRQIFAEEQDEFVLKETLLNSRPDAFLSITKA